jgi:hypothetical protein
MDFGICLCSELSEVAVRWRGHEGLKEARNDTHFRLEIRSNCSEFGLQRKREEALLQLDSHKINYKHIHNSVLVYL